MRAPSRSTLPHCLGPLFAVLCIVTSACAGPDGERPSSAIEAREELERRDEEAIAEIERLLEVQAAAWTRGDLETFTSIYAEDASFLSPTGLTSGRQEVLDRYKRRYPDKAAMGELTLEVLGARPASGLEAAPDGGVVSSGVHGVSIAGRWTLRYPADAEREEATGLTLIVFRLSDDGWKIVQDASM